MFYLDFSLYCFYVLEISENYSCSTLISDFLLEEFFFCSPLPYVS